MAGTDKGGRLAHWGRSLAALAAGVLAGGLALGRGTPPGASALIGWNAAAVVYLAFIGWLIVTAKEDFVRARAREEDENRAILLSVVVLAAAASLGAMIMALHDGHAGGKHGLPPWLVAL